MPDHSSESRSNEDLVDIDEPIDKEPSVIANSNQFTRINPLMGNQSKSTSPIESNECQTLTGRIDVLYDAVVSLTNESDALLW